VGDALRVIGHQIDQADPAAEIAAAVLQTYDVVFPVVHGAGGEDGSLQQYLDELGVPYVGTGAVASALCFDKWQYKQLLNKNNIPCPVGELVSEANFWKSPLIRQAFVLKPHDGGSSLDTLIVRDPLVAVDNLRIGDIFQRHSRMLLELLIEGVEITVAILGQQALPVIEIIPPRDAEFDYINKYNGLTQELCPPHNVSIQLQECAQALASVIHELTGCRDFSRTDMIITPRGELQVLETNTIPGMTTQSLFPKAAATAGIPMPELVNRLTAMALDRSTR